jgi:putative DNA primase/helicase
MSDAEVPEVQETQGVPELIVAENFANDPGNLTADQDQRRQELRQAAERYTSFGWRVLPIYGVTDSDDCQCPRGAECPSPGKHPVHLDWPGVATSDTVDAVLWWRAQPAEALPEEWWPLANLGIATGKGSDIFVLDVDPDNGGDATLARYEARYGEIPPTRIHITGSGGRHYFFHHPGFEVRNSARKVLGEGLDIRGEAGQVVAPPSRSAKGDYLMNPAHDLPIAEAPTWLTEMLRTHDTGQRGEISAGAEPRAGVGYYRRYSEAAIRSVAEDLRNAPSGDRNNRLNECAFRLGTLGGAGMISEEEAWTALHDAALAVGLSDHEIRPTFNSGWRKGLLRPREVQWNIDGTTWPLRAWTEFGNADRMVDHFGDTLRWCPERNTWMAYEGGVWEPHFKESGTWFAQVMFRNLENTEALALDTEPDEGDKDFRSPRQQFLDWVKSQHTRKAIGSAADLAKGIPLMRISQRSFDPEPLLLNALGGVVNLTDGAKLAHDCDQRMTMQCRGIYNRQAPAPAWDAFLRRVQPDPDMRAYLQRLTGYSATALMTEQVIFLHYGGGANGKSVFHSVISHVLGTYAQTVPVETLLSTQLDGQVPNDIARMAGRRYLQASETKAGKSLDEQRVKQLTGGDTVSARFMRGEFFEFRPVGKIHLTSNHLPHLSDDEATWRRVHLIPWSETIPPHERDGLLAEKLIREESSGILNWIISGTLSWQEDGLLTPSHAEKAKEAYRMEEDVIGQFIADCLDTGLPRASKCMGRSAGEIFAAYQYWAKERGYAPGAQRGLTEALQKKGHEYITPHNWRGFPTMQVRGVVAGPG